MTDGRREPAAWGRPLDRRAFLGVAGVGGAALIAAACGGGGSSSNGGTPQAPGNATAVPRGPLTTVPSSPSAITPAILTQDFVAKQDNRFAVGLLDAKQALVKGAAVHLRFFTVDAGGETGTFRGEGDAQFVELGIEDEHAYDASPPGTSGTSVAFYVVNTPFDAPGKWAVEIQVTLDGSSTPTTIQTAFDVREKPQSPPLLSVPPASRNDTFATNPDPGSLCTRVPACELHDKVIGDVLGKGRPLVVQFSTPSFCETRFCGPVLEVLLGRVPEYRDRVDFVHIEVWKNYELQQYREAMIEWGLQTEPYTFFMGRDGKVVGKLESIFGSAELASALEQLVRI